MPVITGEFPTISVCPPVSVVGSNGMLASADGCRGSDVWTSVAGCMPAARETANNKGIAMPAAWRLRLGMWLL